MSRLMRTSELAKRPVVTMAGEDVAQVRDVIYAAGQGAIGGFTLAGRGLFSGPLKEALSWSDVAALGDDAVMIQDDGVLEAQQAVIDKSTIGSGSGGNVLGSRVLTDDGTDLGAVVDVILQVSDDRSTECDVVGYEIESSSGDGGRMLIPLPDTLAASAEHLVVPAATTKFVRQDLAGFGAAVDEFRAQLGGQS